MGDSMACCPAGLTLPRKRFLYLGKEMWNWPKEFPSVRQRLTR